MARNPQVAKHFTISGGNDPESLQQAPPAPLDVSKALNRLTSSRVMRRAEKLTELLRYLVETTLSGHAHYLKETTIGVSVFARSPDYDPKTDAIVRSQACRLRAKLKRYYATEGYRDPLIIDIPKGQYSASFSWRANRASEAPLSAEQHPGIPRR